MTISDSLPIQFWPSSQETYNEKEVAGFTGPQCFCMPFNCEIDHPIQIQGTTGETYTITVIDENYSILFEDTMTEVSTGVFEYTLNLQSFSPPFCDRFFVIISEGGETIIFDDDFSLGFGTWSNDGDGDDVWGTTTGRLFVQLDGTEVESEGLVNSVSCDANFYRFETRLAWTRTSLVGPLFDLNIEITILNGSEVVKTILSETREIPFPLGSGFGYTLDFDFIFYSTEFDTIKVKATKLTSGTQAVTASIFNARLAKLGDTSYKSDCIDPNYSEAYVDITYTNSSDFDNMVYEGSPQPEYTIRIPAIFFHEENPQEREDLELSNRQIVSLRKTITEKKMLQVGFVPPYMHRKIQKILMHDTITIDGDNWILRDPYESSIVKDYGLKKAEVWLTKIDSIERNII